MKYRIKITTFDNGRKEYDPQLKKRFGWLFLNYRGEAHNYNVPCNTREEALGRIDLHFAGNSKIQLIEFEYVTK